MAILDSAAIMPRTCVAADQVLVLDTVGSTNTYAADLVRAGRLFGMDGMDGIAGNLVWSVQRKSGVEEWTQVWITC